MARSRKPVKSLMPKSIVIGSKRFKLRIGSRDLEDGNYAHFDADRSEIVLHPNASSQDRGDSVLHEFVHLSFHIRGVNVPNKVEEQIATVLGGDLHELLTRNPELVEWIKRGCP